MEKGFEEDAPVEEAPPVGTAPGVLPAEPPEGAIGFRTLASRVATNDGGTAAGSAHVVPIAMHSE